jgi:hypothetical protein
VVSLLSPAGRLILMPSDASGCGDDDPASGEDDQDETSNAPLAGHCSLCGGGYNPNLEISIGDEPTEGVDGELEYRWCHKQCKRDHDRFFAEAEPDDGWDLPA